jgi:hypothetical protein
MRTRSTKPLSLSRISGPNRVNALAAQELTWQRLADEPLAATPPACVWLTWIGGVLPCFKLAAQRQLLGTASRGQPQQLLDQSIMVLSCWAMPRPGQAKGLDADVTVPGRGNNVRSDAHRPPRAQSEHAAASRSQTTPPSANPKRKLRGRPSRARPRSSCRRPKNCGPCSPPPPAY